LPGDDTDCLTCITAPLIFNINRALTHSQPLTFIENNNIFANKAKKYLFSKHMRDVMNLINKLIAMSAVMAMAGNVAYAQTTKSNGSLTVRGVAGMGLTFGGEKLATATYTNGTSIDIKAGDLAQFKVGAEFAVAKDWAIQTTIGYHTARANASNGGITFQRFPLEGLMFYQATPAFRIGAGLRAALSPKLSGSGVTNIGSYSFNTKPGVVLEGEFTLGSNYGITLRAVGEKYGIGNTTIDGSHGGIGFNFYF
jgi:Tfp pilus assembly protein PilZ